MLARSHLCAMFAACSGELIDTKWFPASSAGTSRAADWASRAPSPPSLRAGSKS
ncbi:hypothetical protein [Arthrobacter sp. AQ5-05]|uniref:hypothetical protein n=1 Tax=Arthrobacter sp. AQ5-05 TaxID=2184581 RepID=UPI0015ECA6C6|nr:hypothetical protein [Arthrobacter sp. AQ5-05]